MHKAKRVTYVVETILFDMSPGHGVMSRIERSYENCEIYDNSQDH